MKWTSAGKGYSLTELMAVIMVLGVVAAAGTPVVAGYFRSNNLE